MDVERFLDPVDFLEAALPLLLEDEARHNLILGIAATLRDNPEVYPEFDLFVVRDAGQIAGAALRTPPHSLVLARPWRDEALDVLARAVGDELPGVVAALPEVEVFAAVYTARTGAQTRLRFAQGIYALERVRQVPVVPGRMRAAAPADRPLLLEWAREFAIEALHEAEPDLDRLALGIDRRLSGDGAGIVLWEDKQPVSFAGFGGGTPNGIRIGPVYTPSTLRGRGYATALVAQLSADLLAQGRSFCFLYADLANPTSNQIYERIGYERVCDSAELTFER
jgi:predicted GNAT family acetyltransferase